MPKNITFMLLAVGLFSSVHASDLFLNYEFEEGSGSIAASSSNANTANTLNLVGSSSWGNSMPGLTSALAIKCVSIHTEGLPIPAISP